MPLPTDSEILNTSKGLVETLHEVFGRHPGVRPSHAKGIFVEGTFTPTSIARTLSIAPHFTNECTPVLARFSLFTGIHELADTDVRATPHGFAVRFILAETPRRIHTDIISHASPLFVGSTGEEVLAFFRALADNSIDAYAATHTVAAAFLQESRPVPSSFAREVFFSINAFKLLAADGQGTYVRYRWVPVAPVGFLTDEDMKSKGPNFLFDELRERLGREPVSFKLMAQVAEDMDVTDDCTAIWPEERRMVELGVLSLEDVSKGDPAEQQGRVIFDPIPRVQGIEPSADPILQARAGAYLISGRERRNTAS